MKLDVLQLTKEAEKLEAAKIAYRQKALDEQIDKLRAAVDEVVGLIANDPNTGDFCYEVNRHRDLIDAGWRKVKIEGLLPFYAVARFGGVPGGQPIVNVVLASHAPNDNSHKPHARTIEAEIDNRESLAALMKQQRDGWLKQKAEHEKRAAEALDKEMTELRRGFTAHRHSNMFFATEAEAQAALERLKEYYGRDGYARLDGLYAEWQAGYLLRAQELEQAAEKKRQQEAARARYRQQLEEYQAAFAAYWASLAQVQAENAALVDSIQARWNKPYELYELTYAMVATSAEDGERYVDRKTVACIHPPQGDFHHVLRYGQVKLLKFMHVVSLTPPAEVLPAAAGSHAPAIDVSDFTGIYEQEIFYHPLADRDEVARDIGETMTVLPVEPPAPDVIDYEDIKTAKGRVISDNPEYVYHRRDW